MVAEAVSAADPDRVVLGDTDTETLGVAESVALDNGVSECVRDADADGEPSAVPELEADTSGERDALLQPLVEGDAVGELLALGEDEARADAEGDLEADKVADGVLHPLPLARTVALALEHTDGERERVPHVDALGVAEVHDDRDEDSVVDREGVCVALPQREVEGLALDRAVGDGHTLDELLAEENRDVEGEREVETDEVRVGERLADRLSELQADTDGDCVVEADNEADAVTVRLPLALAHAEELPVAQLVGNTLRVARKVAEVE